MKKIENEKIEKLLKKKKFKLATVRAHNNSLIYVDDLKAWEKDTGCGEYEESKDAIYKKIVIMVEGSGIHIKDERECTGKYYGLKSILSNCADYNDKICVGTAINDLYAFLGRVRGTSNMYVPYEYIGNKKDLKRKDLKLCYIDEGVAYFSNNKDQWGDDWNDAPYEHNAGTPYEEEGFEVLKLGFYTGYKYSEPCNYFYGKHFSVEEINCKFVPWLIPDSVKNPPIFAGESVKEFVEKIKAVSGDILYGIQFENYDY